MKFKLPLMVVTCLAFAMGAARTAYAAPPTDACSLLTPAQVSAVLGVPATGKSLGPKICFWIQTGVKPGSPRRRADLVLMQVLGFTWGYAAAKTPNAITSATHVSGLGDDAYYLSMTRGHQNMEIRVKKGNVAFAIRVPRSGTPFTLDQIKAKEKTLALDVLARL